ncbi:MAG: hypothetical protein FD126_1165, partial [Elusimicrobia bacterium]
KAAAAAVAELARQAADPKKNLFPQVLACAESGSTLGEICAALRGAFGEHHGR